MVILDIYSQNIRYVYKTTILSKATLLILVTSFILIVFPFIVAYRTKDFWLKRNTFLEQPDIKFKGEYLFLGVTNNSSNTIICNDFRHFLDYNNDNICSTIKANQIDYNMDSKIDEFNFEINLLLPEQEIIQSMTLILTMNYKIHHLCPLKMQTAIVHQHNLASSLTELQIFGDLKLLQRSPLICDNNFIDTLYDQPLIADPEDIENYNLDKIVTSYFQRNVSVRLENLYEAYKVGRERNFKFSINVKYPEHKIHYLPGFWQVIKWAWIQYLAIFIVFKWFFKKIINYVFNRNLVLFYKSTNHKQII